MEFDLYAHCAHVKAGKPPMLPVGTEFIWLGEGRPYWVLIEEIAGGGLQATVSHPDGGPVIDVLTQKNGTVSCVTPYMVRVLVRMALASLR